MGYSYYDTPDGEDCFLKVWYTSKIAAATGVLVGSYDAVMYSKTKGVGPTLARVGFYVGPLVGIATTFTTTVYVVTNIRKKDDPWNYFIGGLAAGGVFGAWAKKASMGVLAGFAFGMMGVVKKMAILDGATFFPNPRPVHSTVRSHRYDWTLMPNIPGNWTTGKDQ